MSKIGNAEDSPLYLTWENSSGMQNAYAQTNDNVEAYDGIQKSSAYSRKTSFVDIEPSRSVRTSFLRSD